MAAEGMNSTSSYQGKDSCRGSLRDSEYYGSMSAGSIVGATRGTLLSSNCGSAVGGSQGRRANHGSSAGGNNSNGRSSGRREARSNAAPSRPEQFCRANLVPQFETLAKIPVSCMADGEMGSLRLQARHKLSLAPGPTRSVWLVCTANALTVYDGASRRARLATFATRQLYVVEARDLLPLPPPLPILDAVATATGGGVLSGGGGSSSSNSPSSSGGDEGAEGSSSSLGSSSLGSCGLGSCGLGTAGLGTAGLGLSPSTAPGFGLVLGFHAELPATSRPPPKPLPETAGDRLEYTCFLFPSRAKQLRWMQVLQQAADPKPPIRVPSAPLTVGPSPHELLARLDSMGVAGGGLSDRPQTGAAPAAAASVPVNAELALRGVSLASAGPVMRACNPTVSPVASAAMLGGAAVRAAMDGSHDILSTNQPVGAAMVPCTEPGASCRVSAVSSIGRAAHGVVTAGGPIGAGPATGVNGRALIPSAVGLASSHDILPAVAAVVPVLSSSTRPVQGPVARPSGFVPNPVPLFPVDAGGAASMAMVDDDDPLIPEIEAVAIETVAAVVADFVD